ncbi:MAG: molybdopterin-dependent oxidoreductase [Anaerolineales bacterium]|nr:molybdopterin-dependent oxidoreductase [Anaerolineales bacterium]
MNLTINGQPHDLPLPPNTTLLRALRTLGYYSVKHGCETGECGACTVLLDGQPVNACIMLAAQAEGHTLETIEDLGEREGKGWRETEGLHPLQQTFVETGAIQCGFCTPAMLLAARDLLARNPDPTEADVRESLSGILCRCTGYLKPVQAILQAAAILRGEQPIPEEGLPANWILPFPTDSPENSEEFPSTPTNSPATATQTRTHPIIVTTPQRKYSSATSNWKRVGKPDPKVDAVKLALGKPAFTDDMEMRGMLYAKVLWSPVAHARIKHIDASRARALPGVAAVLTWHDLPRVVYSTAGQSDPIPGPLDMFSLDHKVRYVGDRVAFVAAETPEIAEAALRLIEVEYEELPALLDSSASLDNVTLLHDEPEYVNFAESDPARNLAAHIHIDIGDVEQGFAEADHVFEEWYEVPKVQQAHIEPHIVITYWDEDDRLTIRTSTQVPFHARRILAPVLGLPIKRIRVIKPRIGGGFGGKQEVMVEDVAAHLTIATGRPVRFEYTREEEFITARSRHPMKVKIKTGVKNDGTITANEMYALSDTGAYGCHALTVTGNTGHKAMALYVGDGKYREKPNIRFVADIVYTNTPPAGAYRGYGVPQGYWPVERHIERISRALHLDPIEFRLKNALRQGELQPFSTAWSEGREPSPETIQTNGLEECVAQARAAIGWDQKYGNEQWHGVGAQHVAPLRKGIGVAMIMQGTAIPYLDMGGASIKMNDDGSFNLLVGATDLGTGSDTVLVQIAAEILGVELDDIIVYSSDTDFTPFDVGAYASSTTYISGAAVARAANTLAEQICERAGKMLKVESHDITLADRRAYAPDGRFVTMFEIGHHSLHKEDQRQLMAVGSYVSPVGPPPFAAQFAEVTVDTETGMVTVDKLVMAVDSGVIVNPLTASGQIEGGMTQALGYAVCEEMVYDKAGNARERDLLDYHIPHAHEMPDLTTIFVETFEPSHPFGLKAVAEIPMDGVAPAVGNAILDACGADLKVIPATPERIWRALKNRP